MERNLQTIFEISEQSLNLEWLILLLFIIVGVLAYRNSPKKTFGRYFSIFYLSLSVGFLLFLGIGNTYSFFQLKAIYKNKEYKITEGYVRDFVPAKPKSGETYTVKNIKFRGGKGNQGYSGDWESDGRINEGVYVRLFYIETKSEKIILRVDIDR